MRHNIGIKLAIIGLISGLMLIALASINGLVNARKHRLSEVQDSIASKYAGEQQIGGPVFAIAFQEQWSERTYNKETDSWYEKELVKNRTQWVFPQTFHYSGEMNAQQRAIGIFKANIFESTGVVTGSVAFPEFSSLATISGSSIVLISTKVGVVLNDVRGLSSPKFIWNGKELDLERGNLDQLQASGIHAELPDAAQLFGQRFDFEFHFGLNGMGQLAFIPLAADNTIALRSNWPHPSFTGDFLPKKRTITDDGFSAEWSVNGLATSAQRDVISSRRNQSLGVRIIDPINIYSMTDRALKYGFLFIFLIFAAFFLFEMLAHLLIHPVQYLFVGLAQAIFFLLTFSLSEHVRFGLAYLIASLATIALITLYLSNILKSMRRGLGFGGLLTLLYSILYALLQSEDHALISGSILIFILMSLVMILTRHTDWYALTPKDETALVKEPKDAA